MLHNCGSVVNIKSKVMLVIPGAREIEVAGKWLMLTPTSADTCGCHNMELMGSVTSF